MSRGLRATFVGALCGLSLFALAPSSSWPSRLVSFATGAINSQWAGTRSLADLLTPLIGGPFVACATGWVKGGGYDSTTERYAWTCLNYNWSSEVGGDGTADSAWETATTTGGNAYNVTCTGAYNPHTACRDSTEYLQVNAMPDMILAQEMTMIGGDMYLPLLSDKSITAYVSGRSGADSDGNANNAPTLRPPRDSFFVQAFALYGNRRFHVEGHDASADDATNTGVRIRMDTGHDNGGASYATDPGCAACGGIPRRQNAIGGDQTVTACDETAGNCTGDDDTGVDSISMSDWSRVGIIAGSDPSTLCLDNRTAGSTGSDKGGLCNSDPRFRCNDDDGDCPGGAGDCISFAEKTSNLLTAQGGLPQKFAWRGYGPSGNSISGGLFYIESVSATACDLDQSGADDNDGLEVSIVGDWPMYNPSIVLSDGFVAMHVDSDVVNGQNGWYEGGVWEPANSRMYKITASDVGDATGRSQFVALIVDDDGSCSETSGTLDGGGSTTSECLWNGSAWSVADCEGTEASEEGCEDESAAFTGGAQEGGGIRYATIANWGASPDTQNPVYDGWPVGIRKRIEHSTFKNFRRRATDTGLTDYEWNTFENITSETTPCISLGFVEFGDFRNNRLINMRCEYLFATGEGVGVNIFNNDIIGVDTIKGLFLVTESYSKTTIAHNTGFGNRGPLLIFQPLTSTDIIRSVVFEDNAFDAHQGFEPHSSDPSWCEGSCAAINAEVDVAITLEDGRRNLSFDTAFGTVEGPIIIRDNYVHSIDDGCFLGFPGGIDPDDRCQASISQCGPVATNAGEACESNGQCDGDDCDVALCSGAHAGSSDWDNWTNQTALAWRELFVVTGNRITSDTGTNDLTCTWWQDAGAAGGRNEFGSLFAGVNDVKYSRWMPYLFGNWANGSREPDWLYPTRSAAQLGDAADLPDFTCYGVNDDDPDATDTDRGECLDADADGVLDTGTAGADVLGVCCADPDGDSGDGAWAIPSP